MKSVFYLRVSTKEQDFNNQLQPLRDFAAGRKWEVVKIYAESESAFVQGHQKQLELLKQAARRGEFDILLVWSLDRLTRQGEAAIFSLIGEFATYGVKIVSYQEAFTEHMDADNAELFIGIAAWLAKMESKRRSERIRAASVRTKENGGITAKGKKWGRPPGKKDGLDVKRKRSGYYKRWENDRELGTTNIKEEVTK